MSRSSPSREEGGARKRPEKKEVGAVLIAEDTLEDFK